MAIIETSTAAISAKVPSGIDRPTKRLNAAYKKANHLKNVESRRQMNAAADKSEGKNPRPGKFASPPAPHQPARYRKTLARQNEKNTEAQ